MRALDAATVLGLWERAEPLDRIERALALADDVLEETTIQDIGALPLGERDALLLDLYQSLATSRLEGTVPCPRCSQVVEFSLDIARVRDLQPATSVRAPLEIEGIVIEWRPPTSQDLLAAGAGGDLDEAEAILIKRCLKAVDSEGRSIDVKELSPGSRKAAADAIAAADPLSELMVDLKCPECGHSFDAELDVAAFAWSQVEHRARQLLRDIDSLARAYGWSEPQVLALSEQRRTEYLRLVGTASS